MNIHVLLMLVIQMTQGVTLLARLGYIANIRISAGM
jgi:hypothetical protein